MALFRVTVTRWVDDSGRRVKAGTPGARKIRKKSRKWYGEWTDERGKLHREPLSPNRTVAGQMLRERLDAVERARVGWAPNSGAGARRDATDSPDNLEKHLAAYEAELASGVGRRRPSAVWLARELARVRRYLAAGSSSITTGLPETITLAGARDFLAGLGKDGEPVAVPAGQEEFTPAEVRTLLGLSGSALSLLARRHRISAHGKGKARRYPRASVLEAARRQARGCGRATLKLYARTLRSFTRWLVRRGVLQADPLSDLYVDVNEGDHRKVRRALTTAELARLLGAARASTRVSCGLDGESRWALYLTAYATGFRAGALAGLTPEDFDLASGGGTVRLAARGNKSRRVKLQPLPPGVEDLLRPWLASRPAGQPLWPGGWVCRAADMIRADLLEAGVPYAVPSLDGPLEADFHALRHTCLTHMGRAGVELRTLQLLAGHSSPTLTARYSHRDQADLEQAVLRFPGVPGAGGTCATGVAPAGVAGKDRGATAPDGPPLASTGTDGAPARLAAPSFPPGEPTTKRSTGA